VQGREHRNAIAVADHRLAVDRQRPRLELGRGSRDGRISVGPVEAAACKQPHRVAVAPDLQPVAVVLDFVDPIRPGRRLRGKRRDARRDEIGRVGTGGVTRRAGRLVA
jgi:hypothetical protein